MGEHLTMPRALSYNPYGMQKISIHFDNRLSEHIHAARLYDSRQTMAKIDKVVACILAIVGIWFVYAAGIKWWTLIWFVLAPIEWFNLLSLRPLQVYSQFKFNPKFRGAYRLVFDEEGMQFETDTIDSRILWTHYSKVIESHRVFLLIYGPSMYSVIPKRAFENGQELQDFKDLLGHRITPRGL